MLIRLIATAIGLKPSSVWGKASLVDTSDGTASSYLQIRHNRGATHIPSVMQLLVITAPGAVYCSSFAHEKHCAKRRRKKHHLQGNSTHERHPDTAIAEVSNPTTGKGPQNTGLPLSPEAAEQRSIRQQWVITQGGSRHLYVWRAKRLHNNQPDSAHRGIWPPGACRAPVRVDEVPVAGQNCGWLGKRVLNLGHQIPGFCRVMAGRTSAEARQACDATTPRMICRTLPVEAARMPAMSSTRIGPGARPAAAFTTIARCA